MTECLTTFLLNLSAKMGLPDRNPEAITKHTACALNAWGNNDPEISADFFIQEELASVEKALVRRNAFLKVTVSFIFCIVIAVIAAVVMGVMTESNRSPVQVGLVVLLTLALSALAIYLLLREQWFSTREITNFDIVSIEENRLNKALCAYSCCPC